VVLTPSFTFARTRPVKFVSSVMLTRQLEGEPSYFEAMKFSAGVTSVRTQASTVKFPLPKSSPSASGTSTSLSGVVPGNSAAVPVSRARAPSAPGVTPLRYVPSWPWPVASAAVVAPAASPSRQ
jgi:hypothetical protein